MAKMKKLTILSIGMAVEQLEFSSAASGSLNWPNQFEKLFATSPKVKTGTKPTYSTNQQFRSWEYIQRALVFISTKRHA